MEATFRRSGLRPLTETAGPQANSPPRAVIKTAAPDNKLAARELVGEYCAYRRSGIAAAPSIRTLYEVIDVPCTLDGDNPSTVPCLVLEWMDCSLHHLSPGRYLRNPVFLHALLEGVLNSLVVLAGEELINAGTTPPIHLLASTKEPRHQTR